MSRNSKWKLEQNKVKVVFRLQFHATHIPQSGWDKLFVSFISADTGKVTAKTTKANVRNGMCKWADPIYETTRLLQDSKTKQFDDKLYKIVVAMGSSRSGTLGEATVNLSDYVDALKPSTLSVPLTGCNFGTVIHITVQLLTSKTGFREFEQQRELREGGFQSGHDSSGDNTTNRPYPDDIANGQIEKVNARVKFKTDVSELSSVGEEANLNEEYTDSNSAAGFDGSSNASESQYADKHEHDGLKNNVLSRLQSSYSEKGDSLDHHKSPQDSSVSAREWTSKRSINNELTIACEENNRLRESLELAESSLFDLKLEVNSLQGLADELGTETQKLSHLLASEISSSQELAKEVYVMKSECSKFKDDIIKLQDLKLMSQTRVEARDHQVRVLKGIEVAEGKITELQKKSHVFSHDRDTSFIHSELEALCNVLRDIKHGIDEQFPSENGFGLDLCQPGSILQHFNMIPSVSDVNNPTDAMETQIFDLVRELDEAKVEKEAIIQKMHQMELYYEALVQELEENQKLVIGELQHVRNEHSTCLYTLSANRAEMESMHENILKLADERNDIESLNRELEKRATTSESALRRARLNYSIAVDKLQKDLELLSSQVVSMFESNESLIKQAFTEPPEDDDARKISQYQTSNLGIRKRSGGRDVILEDLKRSFCLQEELYQKVEEELVEMHSVNLNLDIYSKALECSLLEANSDFRITMKKMDELSEELEISTASQNQLMVRLQKATEDVHALNEYNSSCISQCNDMALQNQLLEDQIESISKENYLFGQKLKERDVNFEACLGENAELSLLLKQEALENEKLQTEISVIKENLINLKSESDEVISLKRSLEENISFVQDKLYNLMASYYTQFDVSANYTGGCVKDAISQLEKFQKDACDKIVELTKENRNLESGREIVDASLNSARSEIWAMKQKFKSEMESMVSKVDLTVALVGKLQTEFESVADKMQISSEFEEKYVEQNKTLLADLVLLENQMQELTCNSSHLSRDISGLDDLAVEIGRGKLLIADLTNAKEELLLSLQDKTENLRNLSEELCKEKVQKDELDVKVRDLTSQLNKDNDKFVASLQEKNEESVKLVSEINCLKENLRNLQDELEREKVCKDDLERKFNDVTSQLNKDNNEFAMSLHDKNEESIKLVSEIDSLKEKLRNLQNELVREKFCNDDLEKKFSNITSQLKKDNEELQISLQGKNEESFKLASEIDSLKADLRNLHDDFHKETTCKNELERKVSDLISQLNKGDDVFLRFEQQNVELLKATKLASDLELEKSDLAYLNEQQKALVEKLQKEISFQATLESQLFDMEDTSLAADVKFVYLLNQHETLHKELQIRHREAVSNQHFESEVNWSGEKSNLLTTINSLKCELESSEAQNQLLSNSNNDARDQLDDCKKELEKLRNMLKDDEEEINLLTISKEEREILAIVLKDKITETCVNMDLAEEYKDELKKIRLHCNELSRNLSEQVLKTEEFKNLSTHLKALKDKAEAECTVAREKRDDNPSAASQDSLRIAFLKEQYATKFQDLTHQLSISKKHGEEMLIKLQDCINEIENRKKSEAISLRRNEELSLKLLTLEAELQSVIGEKREKVIAYDRTKVELECALLSLECCKEEKDKLEASFRDFEAEKSQLVNELTLLKGELDGLRSSTNEGGSKADFKLNGSIRNDDGDQRIQPETFVEESPKSNGNDLDGVQMLRSSMENLHEQLEKMKIENLAIDKNYNSTNFHISENQLTQLHKANEELRNMFPSFNEIPGGGNALESVLALEMELAESLQSKNKTNILFQNSFLKQHSNEEAILKSFRDINELIMEMLELKGKHENVEAELREMHERYSQLSLQFAEVEGERQKLMMTLKSVRASRRLLRSSSADLPKP